MEGYQNYFFRNGNSLEAILLERESTVFVCLYHLQTFFLSQINQFALDIDAV